MRKKKHLFVLLSSAILLAGVIHFKFLAPIIRDNNQWSQATELNTAESYDKYLVLHPNGRHVEEANRYRDDLLWKDATTANSIRAYQYYINSHFKTNGVYMVEAKKRIDQLKHDDIPFSIAKKINSISSWENFLIEFPGHYREIEGEAAIAKLKGTVESLSRFVCKSPSADSILIDEMISEISKLLLNRFHPNVYKCNMNLFNLKSDILTLIEQKKPIVIACISLMSVRHDAYNYFYDTVFYEISGCGSQIKSIDPYIIKIDGNEMTTWTYKNILKIPIRLQRFQEANQRVFITKEMLGNSSIKLTISGDGCGQDFTHNINNITKK